jgi:RNA polymerase sigma factor (sigma-70 family)
VVPPAAILALAEPAVAPLPRRSSPAPARRTPRDVRFQLAALHERHSDELLRFCRWMLKNSDDAADALQDTWIRAMSALTEDGVRVASMRPWLYAIARNACLDRLRERKRASSHELDEAMLGEGPAADEVAGLRNEARVALARIGTLSERQRTALLMRELAGMSVPEIADALGVSVDRATWAIADARKALEQSDGAALACDAARERLERGARGRAVRAHLASCDGCRAHDRSLRAKRVLAPALLPLLWLRRGALWFASPAAVAVVATTVALQHHAPAPPMHHVAPAPRVAPAAHETPRPHVFSSRAKERVRATPRRASPSVPASHPNARGLSYPSQGRIGQPKPQAEIAAAPQPQPAHVLAENARHLVRNVVSTTQRTVDAAVPAAAPVVDRATAVVRQVAPGL